MRKKVISFRADYETNIKLLELMALEMQRAENLGIPPLSKSDLINQSIDSFYFTKMKNQDLNPISEYMLEAVRQVTRQQNTVLVNAINSTHYDILIVVEYVRLLCKALNFDEAKDGLDKLLNMEMPWDIAIPEKVDRKLIQKCEEKQSV